MKQNNFTHRNRIFSVLVTLLLISTLMVSARDVRTTPTGKVEISFFDTADQGKLPYKYALADWPEEAKEGVVEAMVILENTIRLDHTMRVGFAWSEELKEDKILAATYNTFINIAGIDGLSDLDSQYKYPRELIHQRTGEDAYGGINTVIFFNATKDWRLSASSQPMWYEQDLITVVLHEMSHGLGISSSLTKTSEFQSYIFDKYLYYADGSSLTYSCSELKTCEKPGLAGIELFYEGEYGMKANGYEPIKLHMPEHVTAASVCHFALDYANDDKGRLLVAGTAYGKSTRYIGGFVAGILKDIGWDISLSDVTGPVSNADIQLADVNITGDQGGIRIDLGDGERHEVTVYDLSGRIVMKEYLNGSGMLNISSGQVYIVQVGGKTEKVLVK